MANEDLIGGQEILPPVELTTREKLFCQAYVSNSNNGTRAAISAGVPEAGAAVWATRALKLAKIQSEIKALTAPVLAKSRLNMDETLRQIAAIATFDKRKLYRPDGTRKKITELDDDTAAAVSHFSAHDLMPYDKLKAVDMAMKHLGGYEKDNSQRGENLKINIVLV